MSSPKTHARTAILKPIARAWALGYLSSVTPRLLSVLLAISRRQLSVVQSTRSFLNILASGLRFSGFPFFCGFVTGGSILFQFPVHQGVSRVVAHFPILGKTAIFRSQRLVLRFLSALLASWLGFWIINSGARERSLSPASTKLPEPTTDRDARDDTVLQKESISRQRVKTPENLVAGKTIDLTLFAATRALSTVAGHAWTEYKGKRKAAGKWNSVDKFMASSADGSIFAVSSGIVMWAWFYAPTRLPNTYNKWIHEAAKVDKRLVEALRRARSGEWVYGKDTGQAPLLQSMCRDYGWPMTWGDPSQTIPIPCEMVHMGVGPSCEKHAIKRFSRAFEFAMATYIPLNVLVKLRSSSPKKLQKAIVDSVRSSAFLASFISIFYYSICLSRTRIGPALISKEYISPLRWDSGLCVLVACATCGWSILLETASKQYEMAMFVAPRAIAVLFPRKYDRRFLYREGVLFAFSAATIITYAQEKPKAIRGVFGRIIRQILVS